MLKQRLQQKLQQKLSPQQIQLMRLIQLPVQEFEQRIERELEENPALEIDSETEFEQDDFKEYEEQEQDFEETQRIDTEDINIDEYLSDDEIPDYRLHSNEYLQEQREIPYKAEESFYQNLVNQVRMFQLSEQENEIATFLIGSINDNGYIDLTLDEIVDELAFSQFINTDNQQVEEVFQKVVFQLDPAGIGARNLKECLLIQLKRKKSTPNIELTIRVLEESFEQFSRKNYEKLIQNFNITEQQLKDIISEVEKLNPKPGGIFFEGGKNSEHIVPDFTIQIIDGDLELILNGRNIPELYVSRRYQEMFETYKNAKNKSALSDTVSFIKQKLDAAQWFIDAVKQRQQTLFVTMNAIMNYQREYFLTGDDLLIKPLKLKDIAQKVGLDVSTISRVANSKYVSTPYGTKLLREFFIEAFRNDQEGKTSTLEVKKILQSVVNNEDKKAPFTDDELVQELKKRGYVIARRTISKYREHLKIPKAIFRKEL